MARDPFTQLVRIDIVIHRRAGNRHAGPQAQLDQFLSRCFVKFASTVSLAANYQSVSKIRSLCH
ncbi:hypothetical protein WS68_01640 [Burkholderia sp. TSV86]|nr:hypothetical protein WS68_01640 [Burkholderia sp. TSV86]